MLLTLWAALLSTTAADESTIVTAANDSISAREVILEREGPELVARFKDAGGKEHTLKAADLVEVGLRSARTAPSPKLAEDDIEVVLTTGDTLMGKVGAKDPERLQLVSRVYGELGIKFGRIRAILFPANSAHLPKRLPEKPDEADILYTTSGDRAKGTLIAISRDGVLYHSRLQGKEIPLRLDQTVGVWLTADPAEKAPGEPSTLLATILTVDGGSVRGEIRSLKDGVLAFKDLYGTEHKVASNQVTGLYIKNGRVVYLSDTEPSAVEEDANYIRGPKKAPSDLDYPYQRDRSARGTRIVLAGVEHRKGLGVRAHSALSYPLGGAYKRFQATLGLDAAARELGAVVGEVWLDGKKVKEIPLKAGDPPRAIDVDVAGGRELRLVVTWGGNGQSDFADWGSARLIR